MEISSTEIKNSFGKYLRLCATEPVYITKNGKIIAKLLNHTEADEIIETSLNLRKVFGVEQRMYQEYPPDRVAEAMEAYNLDRIKMTYEEFVRMNENSSNRYEFIDGEVYMLASPNVIHQRFISRLHIELDRYLTGKPCDAFESPFDVVLTRRGDRRFTSVVQPDLLVICNWKDDLDKNNRYTGTPRLVIEVLSPSNTIKEMITKLDLYRDSGIEEYWIVDPERYGVLVYRFEDYKIVETRNFMAEDVCESMIYPGFRFKVREEA